MSSHIVSRRIYYGIFGALIALTYLTYWVAFQDVDTHLWGVHIALNPVIALAIATSKALLVVLFFMHVRYSSRLTWVSMLRSSGPTGRPSAASAISSRERTLPARRWATISGTSPAFTPRYQTPSG